MKEKTAIDALIDHSRGISRYQTYLISDKRLLLSLTRTPIELPSGERLKESLTNIRNEVENRIIEENSTCKKLLEKIIDIKRYGFIKRFTFSTNELRNGYILLCRLPTEQPEKVLLLSDYQPHKKGELVDYDKIKNSLNNIKSALKPEDLMLLNFIYNKL